MTYKGRLLGLICSYHVTNDAASLLLASLFPVLRGVFGLSYTDVGTISGLAFGITALFQILFGRFSDTYSPVRMLTFGITFVGVSTILVAFTSNFLQLIMAVALLRIFASFYHPVGISSIARNFKGHELDKAMGTQSAFGDLGVFLVMSTSGLLAVTFGWQIPFLFWGLMALFAGAGGALVLKRMPRRAGSVVGPASHVTYSQMLKDMARFIPLLTVAGATFGIISSYGPLLLTDALGVAPAVAGFIVGVWIVTGVVAAVLYSRLVKRVGRWNLLGVSLIFNGIGGGLLAIAPNWLFAIPVFAGLGFSVFLVYPAMFSFVTESVGTSRHGTAFGLVFAVQLMGNAIFVYACGVLADLTRTITTPFLVLFFMGIAGGVYTLFIRKGATSAPSIG